MREVRLGLGVGVRGKVGVRNRQVRGSRLGLGIG